MKFKKIFLFFVLFFLSLTGGKKINSNGFMRTELNNGMVILTQEYDTIPVVAVSVWAKVGSSYEGEGIYGISHFLEHMLFRRKPTAEKEATIQAEIEGAGGYLNGATGKEITYYFAVVPKDFAEETLELLLDLFLNPDFDEKDFLEEKKVIIEEISRKDDNPADLMGDLLFETIYENHPYGHSVLGNIKTIQNMKIDSLIEYHKKYYNPGNMIVSIVGDFNQKNTVKKLKKRFGSDDKMPPAAGPSTGKIEKGIKQKEMKKNVNQAYFSLAFSGPAVTEKDHFTLDLLATILGEGVSSRLVERLKEKEKLVNDISCHFFTQKLSGLLAVSAYFNPENTEKVKAGIWEEIEKVKNGKIGQEEIEKAKRMIESNFYFHNELFKDQALSHAYWECLGVGGYEKDYLNNINSVNAEELKEAASKYFDPRNFSQVIIKPPS